MSARIGWLGGLLALGATGACEHGKISKSSHSLANAGVAAMLEAHWIDGEGVNLLRLTGRQVSCSGVAQNTKLGGAIVRGPEERVICDRVFFWPDSTVGKPVRATGRLVYHPPLRLPDPHIAYPPAGCFEVAGCAPMVVPPALVDP